MSQSQLKSYGPQARRDFIDMVTRAAAVYGLTKSKIDPVEVTGDTAVINGTAYPRKIAELRQELEALIARDGFTHTMESMAYTWFNRFMAIRYMELHGYMEHGFRVLSHPQGDATPEILQHAERVDLPGLDKQAVIDLKLDGTRDSELYRMLIVAQCNDLHTALPFLFEEINDATELLLPADLLHSESVIRKMVEDIEEEDWQNVEIVGWLYQFYISEKKDQVIGKVVKSEDIPAATQLFTPNWIVKYMVQNSLGAQWLATYPQSPLKEQMEYYIEPAEQTDEVKAQLAAITPHTLNPEELTLIDPASGSGHILVEAYNLFKAIYLERGYRQRDVAQLILEKNLFGLDIDGRAAQLTGFALLMKGRADDRRLFERGVKLNVTALVDSTDWNTEALAPLLRHAHASGNSDDTLGRHSREGGIPETTILECDLLELKQHFEHATTFGSLIQVREGLAKKIPELKQLSGATSHDLFVSDALKRMGPLVQQAELLAARYDAVVTNPPYMGRKYYCTLLKDYLNAVYESGKSDLYGAFALRGTLFAKENCRIGMITIPNWMFISSFEELREVILERSPISSLVHNGRGVWGSDFGSCSFVLQCSAPTDLAGSFLRLFDKQGSVASNEELERRFHNSRRFSISNAEFQRIPGSPIGYWVSERLREVFREGEPLEEKAKPRQGLGTTDNETFLRSWWEVSSRRTHLSADNAKEAKDSGKKWFPYSKGGGFQKWYGNECEVVNWENDGQAIRYALKGKNPNIPRSERHYFKEGLTWGLTTISSFSARYARKGAIFDVGGSRAFPAPDLQLVLLGLLNSKITDAVLAILNPTISFQVGDLKKIPVIDLADAKAGGAENVAGAIGIAQTDWNAYERSWDFRSLPMLGIRGQGAVVGEGEPSSQMPKSWSLSQDYTAWITHNRATIAEMKRLEEENNRLFIDAYGLADELTPEVPIEQITLTVNPAYRYGKTVDSGQWTVDSGFGKALEARFRQDSMKELLSYAIGCMMGRYSLDEPGLVYAHSGNQGFDASRYAFFPADDDGILPIMDLDWFDDDIANRAVEFIATAWQKEHLEENLNFLADSLDRKSSESSRECIRRYLSRDFYKDHLQIYKKRPIYWLFSSGKQKAFQCLVYLHRYNEGTLARMRTEYVIPLQSKMTARLEHLKDDIANASSTAQARKLEKEQDLIRKQQAELLTFDEKLRHCADQRITLDLDDGVKVNYGKFGDLLAEVKAVTGGNVE